MLNQSTRLTGATPSGTAMMETIKSRFGDITIDNEKAIAFPRGLLGMPDMFRFAIVNFPNEKMQQFMLLQSLDDKSLSFITLPLDINNNSIIKADDLRVACREMQMTESNVAVLLIVSVHRGVDQVKLSVNARAPLVIDVDRRVGAQYVFQQDHYKVQHMLS